MVHEGVKQKCFCLRKSALVTHSALKIRWHLWGSALLLNRGPCPEGAIANCMTEDIACEPASFAGQSLDQAGCHRGGKKREGRDSATGRVEGKPKGLKRLERVSVNFE